MEHPIDQLGGTSAVAGLVGVASATVSGWRRDGIPIKRCVTLEQKTGVMRWALRPGDWWEIWPELMARPDAPAMDVCMPASSEPANEDEGAAR
ncbi:transcriptional regulator [Sphaerotilus natans]|uniref:transcriptional regulator n=1 Tax=Sphaerotilus natans TaxID=34103 RepID=UPI00068F5D6B|nr:YdaS family helix-turn-helix protein [Sphaerotilus natans]